MSALYQERRRQDHDCTRFVIPASIVQNAPCTTSSNLSVLPNEILLYLKNFLNFKDRCCFALTEKHFATTMLDRLPGNSDVFQIFNTERKELEVHPMQEKPLRQQNIQPPPKICTHVCGDYNELLRVLSKDWNSCLWKLCMTCRSFRPRTNCYWERRAKQMASELQLGKENGAPSLDFCMYSHFVRSYKEWCAGEENKCADCFYNPCFWPTGVRDVDFIEPRPW